MNGFAVLGILLRGAAMGAADLVPGVSGGTIALITGIYERLIEAIANIDIKALKMVLKCDIRGAWRHVDATFLLILATGILASIFGLANLIEHLVETQPVLVWSFFSGLLLASLVLLLRMVLPRSPACFGFVIGGCLLALLFALLRSAALPAEGVFLILGGFIAISAMMLPGISGSFLLLVLGLYQPTLAAVTDLNLGYLSLFAIGAGLGFLFFSRLIRYLLHHFHDRTLLFLTGLLAGSLYTTWPWKNELNGLARNVSPASFDTPQIALAAVAFACGLGLVLLLHAVGERMRASQAT